MMFPAWFSEFRGAAALTDTDKMDRLIDDAKDPRLNSPQLKTGLSELVKRIPNRNAGSAEYTAISEDKNIGNIVHRKTIAAIYDSHPLFFETTFSKEKDGWKIPIVNLNADINKVLQADLPR